MMRDIEILAIADILGRDKASVENITRMKLNLPNDKPVPDEQQENVFETILHLAGWQYIELDSTDASEAVYVVTTKGKLVLGALKETLGKHTKVLAGKSPTW